MFRLYDSMLIYQRVSYKIILSVKALIGGEVDLCRLTSSGVPWNFHGWLPGKDNLAGTCRPLMILFQGGFPMKSTCLMVQACYENLWTIYTRYYLYIYIFIYYHLHQYSHHATGHFPNTFPETWRFRYSAELPVVLGSFAWNDFGIHGQRAEGLGFFGFPSHGGYPQNRWLINGD